MQAVTIELSERYYLPVPKPINDQYQQLKNQLNGFDKRLECVERKSATALDSITSLAVPVNRPRQSPSPWIPIIISAVSVIATFSTLAYNVRKLDKLNASINGKVGLTAKEKGLEASIRLLTAAIAPQLVHELDKTLDESAKAVQEGQINAASQALIRVADQADALRQAAIVADQPFFSKAALTLGGISAKDFQISNPAWESLAAYHSAVIQPPNLAIIFSPGSKRGVTTQELANLPRDRDVDLNGFKVYRADATPLPFPRKFRALGFGAQIIFNLGNGEMFRPSDVGQPEAQRIVHGLVVLTPSQTLDNFIWENAVFVNAKISYRGGPVTLNNVRFVNCTFDVPPKFGQPILSYAMLQQSELALDGS